MGLLLYQITRPWLKTIDNIFHYELLACPLVTVNTSRNASMAYGFLLTHTVKFNFTVKGANALELQSCNHKRFFS